MPRIKRRYTPDNAPPIDWLWAAVLERMKQCGYSAYDLAPIAGVEYENMRKMLCRSPWEWKREYRERVQNYFHIKFTVAPTINNTIEVDFKL